jgi:hypothetical protein
LPPQRRFGDVEHLAVRTSRADVAEPPGFARELIPELVEHRRRSYTDQLGELADHLGLLV